ncbi:MAG: hypothetical protein KHW52_06135 [Clostridium sp.]|nr:hypothetical protein [Clostridium sp.]
MKENSIEEDIKIALDKFSDNKDIDSAILIVEKFILGNYILRGGRKNIVKDSLRYILSDYKKVLKENEEWDRKFCNLQNLYFKLQDESESKRKEWQEAYKSEKKMKNEYVKLYQDILLKENVIPVQKVKDKIRHYQELQDNYIKKYDEINEGLQAMINVLQELIEESEE